jgi:hypothetical protein
VLRTHIGRGLHSQVHNLQRGETRRRQLQAQSWSAYKSLEEMVMATVRIEEHVQTMCRQAAAVGLDCEARVH